MLKRLFVLIVAVTTTVFSITINVPSDYSTIQAGISAAVDGDTVLVQPGTYVENVVVSGKSIVLGSEFLSSGDTSYISQTILDGNENGSVLQIFNSVTGSVKLIGLTIQNGTGTNDEIYIPWIGGGGIFTKDANLHIDYCHIRDCSEDYRYGGGVLFYPSSYTLDLTNSIIDNCTSSDAGGGLALFDGEFYINDTQIISCSAGFGGGAAYVGGDLIMQNTELSHNQAGSVGGAFTTDGGDLFFDHCQINGNYSGNGGGAISCGHSSNLLIDKCTIVNNAGTTRGGAIIKSQNGQLSIVNSILQNNTDGYHSQVWVETGVSPDVLTIEYNNIQQDTIAVYFIDEIEYSLPASNLDIDSRFVNANSGDYQLLATSYCINAGHPDSTDADGTRADMGAFPYLNTYSGTDWYITTSGNDSTGTGAIDNPFVSIQAGINFAHDEDSVLVGQGTYVENINFRGRNIKVFSEEGAENTVIDGNQNGSVVKFTSGEDTTCIIQGFTITNGTGSYVYVNDGNYGNSGGGIFALNSGMKIENCIIHNNSATFNGGGIGIHNGSNVIIENCKVFENTALSYAGGGISIWGGNSSISNCDIHNNQAHNGGGIHLYSSIPLVNNNIIHHNIASSQGGGIYAGYYCNYRLINSLVYRNQAEWGGGINSHYHLSPLFVNSTIVNNFATGSGGGISYSGLIDGPQKIINCIVYYNNAPVNSQFAYDESELVMLNSNIQDSTFGGGNISSAPLFVNNENDDYHLSDNSPCIGAGLDTSIVPIVDLDGNPRPNPPGSNPDMGAYENSRTTQIYVDSVGVFRGDTAIVGVGINLVNGTSYSAIDISLSGFQENLEFIDIVTDSSLFGLNNWITVVNETDTLLITASAGADNIITSGTLFWLKFAVPDTTPSQFIPIDISSVILNTDSLTTGLFSGGVQVIWKPVAGFIGVPTEGPYPLSVSFTDTSRVGTYPIDLWIWDLGYGELDTIQCLNHVYDRPGNYDVSLVIQDESGLRDTTIKNDYISIPRIYGDIDFNKHVQSFDASLILKDLVNYITLDSLQRVIGDVSLDSQLSALDATILLQYVTGIIDTIPFYDSTGQYVANGDAYMEDQSVVQGSAIDIPIYLTNGNNIYSFEGTITFDMNQLTLDSLIFSDLLNGFVTEVHNDSGIIKIAGAGINPDGQSGMFALLKFTAKSDFINDSTAIILNKLRWNEEPAIENLDSTVLTIQVKVDDNLQLPDVFALHQNYPNPFNPTTTIKYDIPKKCDVTLTIYNMMGQVVGILVDHTQEPGYYTVNWNASNISSGVYFIKFQAGNFSKVNKCIYLK